jgi:methionyl aminopeptidase
VDAAAEEFIRDHKAEPGFKGLYGCPSTLLISVNEEVVHGLPAGRIFKEGDIASIDCGVYMNEFYGDAAYTFLFNNVDEKTKELCKVTNESLYLGIEQAIVGKRVGDISHAIQSYTEKEHNYGVVRELVGHGLGKKLHEAPDVPNFGRRGQGPILKEGLVIAIEPMITMGSRKVKQAADGWTILTRDKKPAAHYEHSVAIGKERADILSDHSYLKEEIKKSPYLIDI